MEAVNIHIGPLVFDRAEDDAEGDVLYLHVGEPVAAEGEETPEGHVVRFEPGTQRVVGLTVINARSVLDRDGIWSSRSRKRSRPAPMGSPRP